MDATTVAIAVVSVIAYLGGLFAFKKKQITQQLFFLFIYLLGLTAVSHMTVLLPIYFLFSLFPIIIKLERISHMTLFLLFYLGSYLIIGLIGQDIIASITTFVGKIWQFLIFFLAFDASFSMKDNSSIKQLIIAVIIESALGIYLLQNGTIDTATELVRLVSGAQPISGNIAIVVLPISVYLFFKHRGASKYENAIIGINIVFSIWVILSGTRGYMLMYVLTLFFIFYDYCFKQDTRNWNTRRNRIIVLFILIIVSTFFVALDPNILDKVSNALRLGGSLGIRGYENAAELEFFINAPWYVELFGIGLGGVAGEYPAFSDAIMRQLSLGMWHDQHYLYEAGALYHNLYGDILLVLGVIGVVVIIIANIGIWKRITYACANNLMMRRIFHLYQLSFLWMNYYRWSGDCGIAEMIIFALILRYVSLGYHEVEKK